MMISPAPMPSAQLPGRGDRPATAKVSEDGAIADHAHHSGFARATALGRGLETIGEAGTEAPGKGVASPPDATVSGDVGVITTPPGSAEKATTTIGGAGPGRGVGTGGKGLGDKRALGGMVLSARTGLHAGQGDQREIGAERSGAKAATPPAQPGGKGMGQAAASGESAGASATGRQGEDLMRATSGNAAATKPPLAATRAFSAQGSIFTTATRDTADLARSHPDGVMMLARPGSDGGQQPTPASLPPLRQGISATPTQKPAQQVLVGRATLALQPATAENLSPEPGRGNALPLAGAFMLNADFAAQANPGIEAAPRPAPGATIMPLPHGGDFARTGGGGRELVDQIIPALQRGAGGRIEMLLSPVELGRVEITLQARDGGMTVALAAERPETLELLRRHIDLLAEDMRLLGFADLTFSFGGGSTDGSHGRDAGDELTSEGASSVFAGPGSGHDASKALPPPTDHTDPAGQSRLDLRL